jgi:hypothetical protein
MIDEFIYQLNKHYCFFSSSPVDRYILNDIKMEWHQEGWCTQSREAVVRLHGADGAGELRNSLRHGAGCQ